jgi:branched-chain amino acid transport system substrate-binding protein
MKNAGLLVSIGICCLSGCGKKGELDPIVIGHIAPAQGADSQRREHALQGIALAVDEANKDDNLILGRRVQVLHPDCPDDKEAVRAATVRLFAVNKVTALLGGTDPVLVEAMATVAESSKIPLVAGGGMPGKSNYVFHIGIAPEYQGRILARFAREELKAKSVAAIVGTKEPRVAFYRAVAGVFARTYAKEGDFSLVEWTFKDPEDWKGLAERLKTNPPEAVFMAGSVEDLFELRKAGLGEKTPIVLASSEGSLGPLRANAIKNPIYVATAFASEDGQARTKEFVHKYQEKFHESPDVHAALAYDSARFLFDGLRRATVLEDPKLREALTELKQFEFVSGPANFDSDHWAARTVFIVRVENGQSKTVQTYPPDPNGAAGALLRKPLAGPVGLLYAAE